MSRAAEKAASRADDLQRLADGRVSAPDLQRENSLATILAESGAKLTMVRRSNKVPERYTRRDHEDIHD